MLQVQRSMSVAMLETQVTVTHLDSQQTSGSLACEFSLRLISSLPRETQLRLTTVFVTLQFVVGRDRAHTLAYDSRRGASERASRVLPDMAPRGEFVRVGPLVEWDHWGILRPGDLK